MDTSNIIHIGLLGKALYICLSLVGLGFLILIHELGHFLACKIFNIPAHAFSIGFGPALIHKEWRGTEFKISPIPLGGYVAIGNKPSDKDIEQSDLSILSKYSIHKGLFVLFGGIIFNIIFVFLGCIALSLNNSLDKGAIKPFVALPQITSITSSLTENQLMAGDYILAIDGESIATAYDALKHFSKNSTALLKVQISREGEVKAVEIPEKTFDKTTKINWEMPFYQHLSLFDKINFGFHAACTIIHQTALGLAGIFNINSLKKISSIIGILGSGTKEAQKSIGGFIAFLIIVSANLALLNLLPLPILDGGQVVFLLIEKITGKALSEKTQSIIGYSSWALILLITIYATYNDIIRLFFN